ncbi:MAG: hypothetical protein ACYC27_19150 [Armatimonadota bacterium]
MTLAHEWQTLIDNGIYDCAADLAREFKTSRARVTQILRLLKLSDNVLDQLSGLGDPLPTPIITERMLRPIVVLSRDKQMQAINNHISHRGKCS